MKNANQKPKKCIIIAFFLSFLVFINAYSATYYISPSGNDVTGVGSDGNPWATFTKAFNSMTSGDTLILKNGTYTGSANAINIGQYPPDGTEGNYTVIKAENNGNVIFDGEGIRDMFLYYGQSNPMQYVEYRGLVWGNTSGNSVYLGHGEYVKFYLCGFYETGGGNDSCLVLTAHNGESSNNILLEECYAWGNGHYKFMSYQSDHIIFRRCVARYDYVDAGGTDPKGGFSVYWSHDVELQNCIAIDGDTRSLWGDTSGAGGAFYMPNNSNGSYNVTVNGCVALNWDMSFSGTRDDDLGDVDFLDCIGWSTWTGDSLSRGADINYRHCTFGDFTNPTSPSFNGYAGDDEMSNSIFYDISSNVIGDYEIVNNNCFYNCPIVTPGTNAIENVDPLDGIPGNGNKALKYLCRIEKDSDLSGAASDGGDIGANIQTKIGISGTLYGEEGYNTVTEDSLWPFPNEDIIRKNMRTYSDHGIDGTRGFCADGQTLTKYIWEYLGNAIPSDIYGSAEDTIPPYPSNYSPSKGAIDVTSDSDIIVHIQDDGDGVDQTSIVMTVEGSQVTPAITGTPADYILTYDPPADFSYSQVVDVTIDAQDLASTPNIIEQVIYSFTIEDAPVPADTAVPYASGMSPADSDVGVLIDANIVVHIQDDGDGVDQASIVMTVEGSQVTPAITGTPADYILTYEPPADFSYSQVVDVTIDAQDLASTPNIIEQVIYSFTIEDAPVPADTAAPYASGFSPADGDVGLALDTDIVVHIQDAGAGVDQASIVMTVEGKQVIPVITGTPADYILTYDPPADFRNAQKVDITLNANDLALVPNSM
ncbi:hypothetical protein ACFLTD_05115, partial [Elusimicrobiota bacterium]